MMENKTIKGRQLQIMNIILWLSLETYLPYNIFLIFRLRREFLGDSFAYNFNVIVNNTHAQLPLRVRENVLPLTF